MAREKTVNRQPLRLAQMKRYPTYQLYAAAGSGKVSADRVLTIAVLETMAWLRRRVGDPCPGELAWPDASRWAETDSGSFTSFRIDAGYTLEAVWLPEEKIWAMRLTEPDMGPGQENQSRRPVPGRFFETNVAYRVAGDKTECGFRTMVTEPAETKEPCEVYRLGVIKHLARNPLVGLRQGWPLLDNAYRMHSAACVKSFKKWQHSRERMMPLVAIAECAPGRPPYPPLQMPEPVMPVWADPFAEGFIPPKTELRLPFETDELTRYKMGYAQFFIVPADLFESFKLITGHRISEGDALFFEPLAFGFKTVRYEYAAGGNPRATLLALEKLIQDYPKNKPMTFGNVIFLDGAREIERLKQMDQNRSRQEMLCDFTQQMQSLRESHREETRGLREEAAKKDKRIQRLQETAARLEACRERDREEAARKEEGHRQELLKKDGEIARLHALLNRPVQPRRAAEWAGRYYKDKLVFHPRACEMLEKTAPGTVDMNLLCNAIEFLATDYRDELLGRIEETEMLERCVAKYGRPFDVTPVSAATIDRYPGEYKIKYYTGYAGRPVESVLNLHLRVGVETENLLRIYFLYDKEKKLIVVGSLPHHLRTASYR